MEESEPEWTQIGWSSGSMPGVCCCAHGDTRRRTERCSTWRCCIVECNREGLQCIELIHEVEESCIEARIGPHCMWCP
ncbi:unnamed protein product [Victoria cruziana]